MMQLKPPPGWDCLILLNAGPHCAVIHHLFRRPFAPVCSLVDSVSYHSLVLIRTQDLILPSLLLWLRALPWIRIKKDALRRIRRGTNRFRGTHRFRRLRVGPLRSELGTDYYMRYA